MGSSTKEVRECTIGLLITKPPSAPPSFFFFNDTATTEIYTLSLHDALPIYHGSGNPVDIAEHRKHPCDARPERLDSGEPGGLCPARGQVRRRPGDHRGASPNPARTDAGVATHGRAAIRARCRGRLSGHVACVVRERGLARSGELGRPGLGPLRDVALEEPGEVLEAGRHLPA